jgi:hypothetical protein
VGQSLEAHVRIVRFVLFVCVSVTFLELSVAQQAPSTTGKAISLFQQALTALTSGTPPSDVTLSGTVKYIAGSDDETGNATLQAITGASRMDLNLPSGHRAEVYSFLNGQPSGTWSGADGVNKKIAFHNVMAEPNWFFPAFALTRRFSGYSVSYVGHETHNDQPVEHLVAVQDFPGQLPAGATFVSQLTQVDFFLDSTTLLPVAIAFNTHADSSAIIDIPVEIDFSDYRPVNGNKVPFHIHKFLNNSLSVDFQANSVMLNSGLPVSVFNSL